MAKKAAKKAAKKRATPTPRPKSGSGGRSESVPSGPAPYKWQRGYERMVRELVGPERSWAAVTPGNKVGVTTVGDLKAAPFPCVSGDAPAADALALIAILEGLRSQGTERLVVPEGARRWFCRHPELRDHVTRHYATVADRSGAGIVYDLTTGAETDGVQSLLATVNDLARELDGTPAVLDLTELGVDVDLPGFTSFSSPTRDPLPYFDRSIDVVVTDQADDLPEAERVAAVGVVRVADGGGHLRVVEVRAPGGEVAPAAAFVVWTPVVDDALRRALETRVTDSGGRLVIDPDGPPDLSDDDVDGVVLLAPGVLPLPGAVDAAVAAVRTDPDAVVAGKVIAPTGHVESAGGMVFEDGSVAGIAAGTLEVRAPWHEFVRPVCWGGGILAARPGLIAALPPVGTSFVDWCGEAWAAGHPVQYHPRATVVRVSGTDEGHGTADGPWPARRAGRPRRPEVLSDGAWRYLIAHDDPFTLATTR